MTENERSGEMEKEKKGGGGGGGGGGLDMFDASSVGILSCKLWDLCSVQE